MDSLPGNCMCYRFLAYHLIFCWVFIGKYLSCVIYMKVFFINRYHVKMYKELFLSTNASRFKRYILVNSLSVNMSICRSANPLSRSWVNVLIYEWGLWPPDEELSIKLCIWSPMRVGKRLPLVIVSLMSDSFKFIVKVTSSRINAQ